MADRIAVADRIAPGTSYMREGMDLIASYGDAEAIVTREGQRISYAELHDQVLTMANRLWDNGIRPGHAIGLLVNAPVESVYIQLAAHLMGCRTAWTTHRTAEVFRRDFIKVAELDAFIYDTRTTEALGQAAVDLDEVGRAMAEAAAPLPILCLGPNGPGPDLTVGPIVRELPFDPTAVDTEPQSLFQTTGSTGTPKLVHHRHGFFEQLRNLAAQYVDSGEPLLRHQSIMSFWVAGSQAATFMTLFSGGLLVMHESVTYPDFLASIERHRLNSSFVSPPMLYSLYEEPLWQTADLSSMRSLTLSAGPAIPARLGTAIERLGPVLRIVYGMTEVTFITTLPGLVLDPEHPERLGSAGLPYTDTRIEIRDEAGRPVPAGVVGEVWVSSPLVMAGYWRNPELTAYSLVDGWMRTGDAGRLDEDGYLFLVDRVADVIIVGVSCWNIYSRPLEDVLAGHPEVRMAAVIGVPDDETGNEFVHAYVVRTPDATVTVEELRQLVVDGLNEVWSPREVEFIDELPINVNGKVDKKALRARYLADREAVAQNAAEDTAAQEGDSGA